MLNVLEQILGVWEFKMHDADVPEPVVGRHIYERELDGAFVLHRWMYDRPDFPDAIALMSDTGTTTSTCEE